MNMRCGIKNVRVFARFGCHEFPRHWGKLTFLEDELDTNQPRLETPDF